MRTQAPHPGQVEGRGGALAQNKIALSQSSPLLGSPSRQHRDGSTARIVVALLHLDAEPEQFPIDALVHVLLFKIYRLRFSWKVAFQDQFAMLTET